MQFDIPARRIFGPAGEIPVLPDDVVVARLAMLIEGHGEGPGRRQGSREARSQQTAIFSVARALS